MPAIPNFIGSFNRALSPIADIENTMNMYLEKAESPGAIAPLVLYSIPGFENISTASAGFGRAHIFIGMREFFIFGTSLIEANHFGVMTVRGTVALDGNPATICGNGDAGGELFITSGGVGYLYTLATDVLTTIALLNPFTSVQATATMGCSMDGYFIWLDAVHGFVFFSGLNDGTTWDPTQYIQRSQAPDPWVAIGVSNKYLYLLGDQTGEVWYNAGTFPIPFVPASAGLFNYGCVAPFSLHVVGSYLVWVGQTANGSGAVLRITGLRPEEISTDALRIEFASYQSLADGIGDSHDVGGHSFYTVTFPSANRTWAFDMTTPSWCGRGFWNSTIFSYDAWRPGFHAFAFGEDRFLDLKGAGLYRMRNDLATDLDGNGIRWERTAPAMVNQNLMMYYGTLEVIAQTGIGSSTGQGADPQMMMRQSNDGGRTWGVEAWRSMGKIGQYDKTIMWNRGGRARKRTYQIAGSDPVRVMIAGASVGIEASTEAA